MNDSRATNRLLGWFTDTPAVAVALSGGVDSAVVARAAVEVLGSRAVAYTADSPSVPRAELAAAATLAATIGIAHRAIRTSEFADPAYAANDGTRCYYCKSELYSTIRSAVGEGVVICSGANLDDAGDFRPGLTAAAELGVRHPLQEAGFTKTLVRELAKAWGLPVWDKPASPCLSSRIAPGVPATAERTLRIELAEAFLKSLGVADCRVRVYADEAARVELPPHELPRFLDTELGERVASRLRELGFASVEIEPDGLKSGRLNAMVPLTVRRRFATVPIESETTSDSV